MLVATTFVLFMVLSICAYQGLFLMTRMRRQCLLRYAAIAASPDREQPRCSDPLDVALR